MVKRKPGTRPQIISYIVLLLLAFMFVYPFWQTIVMSFSEKVYANAPGFKFWPPSWTLDAYETVFSSGSIWIGYRNTVIRSVTGCLLTLVVTFMCAFAMSHKELPGRRFIGFIITFTMFFGGGMVPTYMNYRSLNLLNTLWVLILPGTAGAWNFIIMRNFVSGIGVEMEEAARIDGAGPFQTMIRIILPLSKAVIAVIALWSIVGHWNAWFDSMVYANKPDLVVLQTVVRRLIDSGEESAAAGESVTAVDSTPETVRAATVMVATLPILAGYPFIQKYLVKGTMAGAVKG